MFWLDREDCDDPHRGAADCASAAPDSGGPTISALSGTRCAGEWHVMQRQPARRCRSVHQRSP
jgi:hypothetical protein